MQHLAKYIADTWNISEPLAKRLISFFEQGYSAYYLSDYDLQISIEMETAQVCEVFDFLSSVDSLAPKKKRLLSALKKADILTSELEDRVVLATENYELEDISASTKTSARSKGQQALKKGLGPLADLVQTQPDDIDLEAEAEKYKGTAFKSADDVLSGVKDILVERFAADETARAMAREIGMENGVFEVIPKSKKERQFAEYAGRLLEPADLSAEELLRLFQAEEQKKIRFKVGVQLFQITEILKEHFIENPESPTFFLINDAIDDCWLKSLQPAIEKDVKAKLREQAESILLREITPELSAALEGSSTDGTLLTLGFWDSSVAMIALDSAGRLLGAASIKRSSKDDTALHNRIRQFFTRHRPSHILVPQNNEEAEQAVTKTLDPERENYTLAQVAFESRAKSLAESSWVKERFADLDQTMQKTLALGLAFLRPPAVVIQAGVQLFPLHPLQDLVSPERMMQALLRAIAAKELRKGIPIADLAESVLPKVIDIPEKALAELQKQTAARSLTDLQNIPGMTTELFSNVAGYLVIPSSDSLLDRTLVHPLHMAWVRDLCSKVNATEENLISDPEVLRGCDCGEFNEKLYIEKHLISQLQVGQRFLSVQTLPGAKRRLKLPEITEGSVVSGRVTNITQFGVFVDINAVCDGLIHISQLADTYVESPNQVVSVGDRVNVRVVSVDIKKRRISLSMKNLGTLAPKIKPTQGQLSTLADHFKNR